MIYVFHPHQQGFFRFSRAGDAGFLVVNATLEADGARNRDIWPTSGEEECIEYVREALGAPDLPVEIENVQRWNASAEWAERFQEGPVFLAGDAVHGMPPTGGFGGNTGVQDAHNLAWKLAFVLDGRAGESLLASYDTERRPVGEFATRAGVHPLRRTARPRARQQGEPPAVRARARGRARLPVPLVCGDLRARRRRALRGSEAGVRESGLPRAAPRTRGRPLGARSPRSALRAAHRAGRRGLARSRRGSRHRLARSRAQPASASSTGREARGRRSSARTASSPGARATLPTTKPRTRSRTCSHACSIARRADRRGATPAPASHHGAGRSPAPDSRALSSRRRRSRSAARA